jgi:bis(5'-nucleosidyl)-tetraphosphatase
MATDDIAIDFAFGLVPVAHACEGGHRYLLICHQKGHWGFPKGHREGEESDLEAAQREFEEETGVSQYQVFAQQRFVEQYQFRKKKGKPVNKTVTYFLALVDLDSAGRLPTVNIQAKEICDYRWCSAAEAQALIRFGGSLEVLAACERLFREGRWVES